jgi:hypothetical protein
MNPEDKHEVANFCPNCGHIIPPKDLDPLKITEWLLDNDPMFQSGYNLGQYEEWKKSHLKTTN